MAEKKKNLNYKTKEGDVLYGFSQTNLEKTNARLNNISFNLKILIILFIVFLIGAIIFMGWVAYYDVITRIIYGF